MARQVDIGAHPRQHRAVDWLRLVGVGLFSAVFCAALAWFTWEHIDTRLERERALAAQRIDSTLARLEDRLTETRERLLSFADANHALLSDLLDQPQSPALGASLKALVDESFVAGGLLLADGEGRAIARLGNLSRGGLRFLAAYVQRRKRLTAIVDTGDARSVAIIAPWYGETGREGILLLEMPWSSFAAGADALMSPGHYLEPRRQPRIEPVAGDQLLATGPLAATGWMLDIRLDSAYQQDLVNERLALAIALALSYLVALATWLWRGRRSSGPVEVQVQRVQGPAVEDELDALGASEQIDKPRRSWAPKVVKRPRWGRGGGRLQPDTRKEDSLIGLYKGELDTILSTTTDGIIITDRHGTIEHFNPSAELMFGRLSEDVQGEDALKLLPAFFADQRIEEVIAPLLSPQAPPLVREASARRKGGKAFPARVWINATSFDGCPRMLLAVRDLSEHQQTERRIAYLTQHDTLTGLLNRKEFEVRLAEHRRSSRVGVLCCIDVYQFKLINDTCGHEAGDQLLKQLTTLIKAKLGRTEVIARLGGDEFGTLFADCGLDHARRACEGLVQTVRNFLFAWRDQSFDIAVSIGIVDLSTETGDASSALSKADVACYMAKSKGRNRMHIYRGGDMERVRYHGDMHLLGEISQALSEGRFSLFAQPIVPLDADAKRRRFEVLVGMLDEDGGIIEGDRFIPAAEQYALMPAVDRWVINRLFELHTEKLRAWNKIAPDDFLFAINLSGTTISDDGFVRYLKRQFAEWDVPYQSIAFELTETAAMGNPEATAELIRELSALGVSFALDDFGAGLASYADLRDLPVKYLKIDGSFVGTLDADPVNHAVVESINKVGHVLGLKTVAERVDNERVLEGLRSLGVDYAQGDGVGETHPADALTLEDTLIKPNGANDNEGRGAHRAYGGTA